MEEAHERVVKMMEVSREGRDSNLGRGKVVSFRLCLQEGRCLVGFGQWGKGGVRLDFA